jgi:hypothetical protein
VGRLFYLPHLLLLAGFGILLGIATRTRSLTDLSSAFALYGALHAIAVAFTLRARQPLWRSVLFVAIAAALSVMTLRIGLFGMQLAGTLPANLGLYVMLGLSAMIAALSYGVLLRLYGIPELSPRTLAAISVACILATYAAFFILGHSHWLGRWLLAVFWWCAFSGGLWYWDQGRSGDRTCSGRTPSPMI